MPTICIRNTGQQLETDLTTSILVSLQREGVPIQSVCGGRAQCGRCAVRIVQGGEFLTKKTAIETIRLNALGASDDTRLACQSYTRGDIEIVVMNLQ